MFEAMVVDDVFACIRFKNTNYKNQESEFLNQAVQFGLLSKSEDMGA